MRIILLGSPGSGKGTQAQFIADEYKLPKISAGDILRFESETNSNIGTKIKSSIQSGKLVVDQLVILLIKKRLRYHDCHHGFILDGFPRTLLQAKTIKKEGITVDYVLELVVPDSVVIERISGRRVHAPSGRTYHVKFSPPQTTDRDDISGEVLTIRDDDREEIIYQRMIEYNCRIKSVVDFYQREAQIGNTRYFMIDGSQDAQQVKDKISTILDS